MTSNTEFFAPQSDPQRRVNDLVTTFAERVALEERERETGADGDYVQYRMAGVRG